MKWKSSVETGAGCRKLLHMTDFVRMLGRVWGSWGTCDVGMHKNMHSHVFMCFLIYHWPEIKMESLSACACVHACVCVCLCTIPVQNLEREAPSCEAEAACQCCPLGTDTRGASGLLNRLPDWVGSHTSRERGAREREREEKGAKGGGGTDIGQLGICCQRSEEFPDPWIIKGSALSREDKLNN